MKACFSPGSEPRLGAGMISHLGAHSLIGQSHARQTDFPAMLDAQHLRQDIPVFTPRMPDLHSIRGSNFAGMTNAQKPNECQPDQT